VRAAQVFASRRANRSGRADRRHADPFSADHPDPVERLDRGVFLEMSRPNEAEGPGEVHEPEPQRDCPKRLQHLFASERPWSLDSERDVAITRAPRAHARAMGEKRKKVRVKRGRGQRTSSTSADVLTRPVYTSLPRSDFDLTPVITRSTRTVFCRSSSTEQPQMIRACGLIFWPTISAAFSASDTVKSGPPTTRTRAPRAWVRSTSPSNGDSRASLIA